MKRLFAYFLAIAMVFVLSACGADEVQAPGANADPQPETVTEGEEYGVLVPETDPKHEVVFEEVIVWDDENCTIKITDMEEDSIWGYTLKAYLENKTADKTMMFSVSSAAINGVSADPLFAAEVAAGKKSNEEIIFSIDDLEENGVGDITDIALNFRVSDSNDWSADAIAEASAHVYPYGEENAVHFIREAQPEDVVLVDNEYVSVSVIGYEMDDIWGYTANLYIVNKADVPIMVSVDEVSVNGYMIDPFYADSVAVGFSAFSGISWSESDFADNGIQEVESIEFVLRVYDETDWMADEFFEEVITLNP